jgi:hypothetical protein
MASLTNKTALVTELLAESVALHHYSTTFSADGFSSTEPRAMGPRLDKVIEKDRREIFTDPRGRSLRADHRSWHNCSD